MLPNVPPVSMGWTQVPRLQTGTPERRKPGHQSIAAQMTPSYQNQK